MRILYIIPTFQHPKVRGPNRHYHFIRELSQRHAITLLTLERAAVAEEALQEMAAYTERILSFKVNGAGHSAANRMITQLPVVGSQAAQRLALRESVGRMKESFRQLVRQESFDVVLFHGKDCFPVIEDWQELPIVTDFCDATSLRVRTKMRYVSPVRAPLLGLRYLQVRQTEKKIVQSTPHLAFISQRDRAAILGPDSQAAVIPNGIDLTYWTRRTHNPEPNCLIFTGVMNYAPNEDAALHLIDRILPLLRPHVPDLSIIIAGRDPTPALLERARRNPEVIVTGFVDDMRDYLEKAAVFAAPLRYASGMQNKIQEALAMEVPVVTTSIVADGLRVARGEEPPLYAADGDEAFARQVVNLLSRPDEQARLAQEGRRFAEKYFVWARSAAHLEQMCMDAVGQRLAVPAARV
jgi:glycosyltransferase involved in cell wall biosynthesis